VPELRISGIAEESIVDGPGLRYVVFTQGCPHHCRGCHNPETHDPGGGILRDTDDLLQAVEENPLLSGVTFSGGEPFLQPEPLAAMARKVKKAGKTVLVYTGYTLEQLVADRNAAVRELLLLTDTLVDGPYIEALRDPDLTFRGSANQRILNKDVIANALRAKT
jgi:anaerobic ribonucleoside-triphosphate reductase activating protein